MKYTRVEPTPDNRTRDEDFIPSIPFKCRVQCYHRVPKTPLVRRCVQHFPFIKNAHSAFTVHTVCGSDDFIPLCTSPPRYSLSLPLEYYSCAYTLLAPIVSIASYTHPFDPPAGLSAMLGPCVK